MSVCGKEQYYDEDNLICTSCHPNCEICINITYCYVCKELAVMVADGVCELQDCEQFCLNCEG